MPQTEVEGSMCVACATTCRRGFCCQSLPTAYCLLVFPAGDSELFRHPDQVSQRVGPHLLHDLMAMQFDRNFAGAQLRGDLFVEESRNDQPEDFAFAWS